MRTPFKSTLLPEKNDPNINFAKIQQRPVSFVLNFRQANYETSHRELAYYFREISAFSTQN